MYPVWRKNYLRYKSFFLNVLARYKERQDIKAYLEILLSLATVSIFAIFALRPTLLTIAQLIREIDSKKDTLSIMDGKIQNLGRAQTLYDQQRDEILLLESSIPDSASPDVFARQIEGLAARHGIELLDISVGRGGILGEFTESGGGEETGLPFSEEALALTFSVRVSAPIDGYTQLTNYLLEIERLRKPVKIDNLNFSSSKEREENRLVLVIQGRLPYFYDKNK